MLVAAFRAMCWGVVAAWQGGSMAAWQHGRVAAWQHGSMAAWQHGSMAAWQHGSMAAWQHGSMEAWKHSHQHRTAQASQHQLPRYSSPLFTSCCSTYTLCSVAPWFLYSCTTAGQGMSRPRSAALLSTSAIWCESARPQATQGLAMKGGARPAGGRRAGARWTADERPCQGGPESGQVGGWDQACIRHASGMYQACDAALKGE